MGQHSMVIIHHDALQYIQDDELFGHKFVQAVQASRPANSVTRLYTSKGREVGSVVGGCFSSNAIQITVAEGASAWPANYQGKPSYSLLNKTEAIRMIFGRKREKVPKET